MGMTLLGLDLTGRRVVVVGGGRVAARRTTSLVEAGADVRVIAPEITPGLRGLPITWDARGVVPDDLDGAWLVHVATDDAELNATVADWAEQRRIWCVQAGRASEGTARTPALAHEAGVLVGVLSAGDPDPGRVRTVRDLVIGMLRRRYVRPVRTPDQQNSELMGRHPWVA